MRTHVTHNGLALSVVAGHDRVNGDIFKDIVQTITRFKNMDIKKSKNVLNVWGP